MREIKFRAWVPKGYKRWGKEGGMLMLSWEELINDLHSELNPKKSVLGIGMSHKEAGVKFMQYTGLKNKNGVEIYESDILEINRDVEGKFKSVVTWRFGAWSIDHGERIDSYVGFGYWTDEAMKQLEIIGNIYENPELLKHA